MDYRHLITITAGKRSGQPWIRDLRITVGDVLEYLASGMSVAEVLADFSELTEADVPPASRSPPIVRRAP